MISPHFDNYGQSVDHFTFQQEIKIRNDHIAALESQVETLRQELEQSSERFQRAQIVASQWKQRAELYEHQRNEWKALLGESYSPCHDCGGSGVVGVLPEEDGSSVIYKFCIRCGGTGKEPA